MRFLLMCVLLCAPFLLMAAEPSNTQNAGSCAEARRSGTLVRVYETSNIKTALQQLDKTSNDTVKIHPKTKQASMEVRCPSEATTEAGEVTICLDPECKVNATVKKEGAFMKNISDATRRLSFSLASGEDVAQEVARQLFSNPSVRQQLAQGLEGISAAFAGPSEEVKAKIPDITENYRSAIEKLADGDIKGAAAQIEQAAARYLPAIEEATKDPQNFARVAAGDVGGGVMAGAQSVARIACGVLGGHCPAELREFGGSVASTETGPVRGAEPVRADSSGRIDPVAFAQRAAYKIANSSLNGVAPEALKQFGVVNGTPEEWGRFLTMLTKQESNLRIAPTNADGTLQRFSTTPAGERSFGPGQFNIGEYGLRTWSDVNNPDRVIDAYIQVAEKGNMLRYFGSLQRPQETLQHASWFEKTVAPYIGAAPSPVRTAESVAMPTLSPISGNTFLGGGTGIGLGSLFSGRPSGFSSENAQNTSWWGRITSLFSGESTQAGNTSYAQSSYGGTPSAPSASPPSVVSAPPVQGEVQMPILTVALSPQQLAAPGRAAVAWAAALVESCAMYDDTGAARYAVGSGKSGTYTKVLTASTTAVRFSLECVPSDSRAPRASGIKSVERVVQ